MKSAALVALACVVSGCAAPGPQPPDGLTPPDAHLPTVIGLVDSGINPYHEVFQSADPLPQSFVDGRTGKPPTPMVLSQTGTLQERLQADAAIWNAIRPGELYWFVGTRILAMTIVEEQPNRHIMGGFHGTGVASLLREGSPSSWIVLLDARVSNQTVVDQARYIAESFDWLADQPWVDVVSSSAGLEAPGLWEHAGYPQALRKAADVGKVVVQAAGNMPTPRLYSGAEDPPWVIGVGGAYSTTMSEETRARKVVDVVSDYTKLIAFGDSTDGYSYFSGTSFGTPVVAAAVAEALHDLRTRLGHVPSDGVLCSCGGLNVSSLDLRAALNATATYWNTTDFRPTPMIDLEEFILPTPAPILPTPWVQMGWGYIGNQSWADLVRTLEGHPPPPKPDAARAYMAQQHALREAYWSQRSPTP